jgi:ABC-type glycerol-3-phosphate transport system substrate-binding protein
MSKKMMLLAAVLLTAAFFTSCYDIANVNDDDDSVLRILWHRSLAAYRSEKIKDPNHFDPVWTVAEEYKARTGKTVEVIAPDWDDWGFLGWRTSEMVSRDERVDLAWMDMYIFRDAHLRNDTLRDIRPYIDPDDGPWHPGASRAFSADGSVYGAGVMEDAMLLYYNKNLFNAYNAAHDPDIKTPGEHYADGTWTWDNFKDIAQKLTDTVNGVTGFGWIDRDWVAFLTMNGVSPLSFKDVNRPAGTYRVDTAFPSDEALRAMIFLQGLYLPAASACITNDYWDKFPQGKIGMMLNWAGYSDDTLRESLEYVPLPAGPDAGASEGPVFAGLGNAPVGFCMPRTCANPRGAAEFIRLWAEMRLERQAALDGSPDRIVSTTRDDAARRSLYAPFENDHFLYGLPGDVNEVGPFKNALVKIREGLRNGTAPVFFLSDADNFIRVASPRTF